MSRFPPRGCFGMSCFAVAEKKMRKLRYRFCRDMFRTITVRLLYHATEHESVLCYSRHNARLVLSVAVAAKFSVRITAIRLL